MKHSILRIFIFTIVMALAAVGVQAQSVADKQYQNGLNAQKTMTVASQNKAIDYFNKAKGLYDSTDKKKKCDQQISKCNKNIAKINKDKKTKNREKAYEEETVEVMEAPKPKIEVSCDTFRLNSDRHISQRITFMSAPAEWTYDVPSPPQGERFLSITPNSVTMSSLAFDCQENTKTYPREGRLQVSAFGVTKDIVVYQDARPTLLYSDPAVVEFSKKGGKKIVKIYCDSSTPDPRSDAGYNWHIVSKPEWVTLTYDRAKDADFNKKHRTVPDARYEDMEMHHLQLVVTSKIDKGTTRQGEIVMASDDQVLRLLVVQK